VQTSFPNKCTEHTIRRREFDWLITTERPNTISSFNTPDSTVCTGIFSPLVIFTTTIYSVHIRYSCFTISVYKKVTATKRFQTIKACKSLCVTWLSHSNILLQEYN